MSDQLLAAPPRVAEMLGVKVSTLSQWRHFGRGPRWVLVGSKVLYSVADVHAFVRGLEQHESTAQATARRGGPGRPKMRRGRGENAAA